MKREIEHMSKRDMPACVGANIRTLRTSQKLSCKTLADMVGVSPSYINRIEHGERCRVSFAIVENLATVFNVTIGELMGEGEKPPVSFIEEHKRDIFQQMKGIISENRLTHKEKIEQLRAVADICQHLLVNRA